MESRSLVHDTSSLRAASLYWQSLVLLNTSLILLTISLAERIIYLVALYAFEIRLTAISSTSGAILWPYLAGIAFLVLAVSYRFAARKFFTFSRATEGLNTNDFIPMFGVRKNPFTIEQDKGVVTWELP